MKTSIRVPHPTEDLSTLTREELVERLWKYVWFQPETDISLAGKLEELTTADEGTARRICGELENFQVQCEAGPLANCTEWIELRRKVGAPSEKWG